MPATDPIERMREGLVAVLDTDAGIVALTGRANGNIVPWQDTVEPNTDPHIRYAVIAATRSGEQPGEFWRVILQASAFASAGASETGALCEAIQAAATAARFAALASPVDVHVTGLDRRGPFFEATPRLWRSDLDLAFLVKKSAA